MSNNNTPQPPPTRPTPSFGGGSSGGNAPRPNPFSRFARSAIWTITPFASTVVRFELRGLGDPFAKLLGTPFSMLYGELANVLRHLETDFETAQTISTLLNSRWETYSLKGAVLMYPAEDAIKKAYTLPIQPTPPPAPPQKPENDESNDETTTPDDFFLEKGLPRCLRAIDVGLVMNVLARTRAQVLVENTPLALETGFLSQAYLSDDPRLVAIAMATGYVEESWE